MCLYIEQMVHSGVNTPVLSSTPPFFFVFLQRDVAFVCLPAAGSGASTFFILWHMDMAAECDNRSVYMQAYSGAENTALLFQTTDKQ